MTYLMWVLFLITWFALGVLIYSHMDLLRKHNTMVDIVFDLKEKVDKFAAKVKRRKK